MFTGQALPACDAKLCDFWKCSCYHGLPFSMCPGRRFLWVFFFLHCAARLSSHNTLFAIFSLSTNGSNIIKVINGSNIFYNYYVCVFVFGFQNFLFLLFNSLCIRVTSKLLINLFVSQYLLKAFLTFLLEKIHFHFCTYFSPSFICASTSILLFLYYKTIHRHKIYSQLSSGSKNIYLRLMFNTIKVHQIIGFFVVAPDAKKLPYINLLNTLLFSNSQNSLAHSVWPPGLRESEIDQRFSFSLPIYIHRSLWLYF